MGKRILGFLPFFVFLYLPFLIFLPKVSFPILLSDRLVHALQVSCLVSISASLLASLIGLLVSLNLEKSSFMSLAKSLLHVPIVLPDLVMALGLLSFFRVFNQNLNLYTLIWGHVLLILPYLTINILRSIVSIHPNIIQAAQVLGCNWLQLFFKVKLPLIFPDILRSFILATMISFDDVVFSFFLSGPGSTNLSLYSYSMTKVGLKPELAILSLMIICILLFLTLIKFLLERHQDQSKG